jgi:AraC-like DNA-binding protein
LLNSAAELSLEVTRERAVVRYRVASEHAEIPAFADSVISSLVFFIRRNARVDEAGWELWFTQPRPIYAEEYARVFSGPIRFGAADNALVLPTHQLDLPMLPRSPRLTRAYQLRAEQLLRQLREGDSTAGRVRRLVREHLGSGRVTMQWAAQQLAMSAPTLRRRLREEDETFSELVSELRRELAERELRAGRATIGEIAVALGFANIGAFDRAFRRWSGTAPSEFRLKGTPNGVSSPTGDGQGGEGGEHTNS